MSHRHPSAREKFRKKERDQIRESPTLAATFRRLKSLQVELEYFSAATVNRVNHIKYKVNLSNAKSMFYFECPNTECHGGDFDLSAALAKAITSKQKLALGELSCEGWHVKSAIKKKVYCDNRLRYKLQLTF